MNNGWYGLVPISEVARMSEDNIGLSYWLQLRVLNSELSFLLTTYHARLENPVLPSISENLEYLTTVE